MNHPKLIKLILLGLYCAGSFAYALSEDRLSVLEMSSGSAVFDQKNHRGLFIKQVTLDQGSTHIRAHRIVTETNEKNQLTKAIIFGQKQVLAHYWVTVSKDKPDLHAYAERIEYYPDEHVILLIGQARVEQGTNSFSAPKIKYHTETQKILTENQQKDGRTVIVFHPESRDSLLEKMRPTDKLKTTASTQPGAST